MSDKDPLPYTDIELDIEYTEEKETPRSPSKRNALQELHNHIVSGDAGDLSDAVDRAIKRGNEQEKRQSPDA